MIELELDNITQLRAIRLSLLRGLDALDEDEQRNWFGDLRTAKQAQKVLDRVSKFLYDADTKPESR